MIIAALYQDDYSKLIEF